MRAATRRLLLTCTAIAAIACGGDSGTGPSAAVQGTYSLSSLNGQALPVTITETDQTGTFSITYLPPYTLTLNSDNSLRIIVTTRFSFMGPAVTSTDTVTGSWALHGNSVTISTVEGDTVSAAWNGANQLTIGSGSQLLVFMK